MIGRPSWSLFGAVLASILTLAPQVLAQDEGGDGGSSGRSSAGSAGDSSGVYTKEAWPEQEIKRPLTLAKGMIEIAGDTLNVGLSSGAVLKPLNLAPSVAYGIDNKMELQLTHATGLCLSGTDGGCAHVYNDVGVDFLYSVMPAGPFNLAVHGGLLSDSFDPFFFVSARLGALGRYRFSPTFAITFDPSLILGITNREQGNKEGISIPIHALYQATPKLAAFVFVGMTSLLDPAFGGFGDYLAGALGLGALYTVNKMVDVGGEFRFNNLWGNSGGAGSRTLILRVAIRL